MKSPRLNNDMLNVPANWLTRLADLERAVSELSSAPAAPVEELVGGRLTIADLILSPAPDVLVADPTSTDFTGTFMAGEGIIFDAQNYVFGNVINGEIKTGFTDVGTLYAIDANISGTIIIGTGSSAGGWLIDATRIYSLASDIGIAMDSSVPIIRVGDTAGVHIQIDGANQRIRSSNFVTGVSGSNWDTASGNAEFNYIVANGGTVGGWVIATNSLKDAAGVVGMSSAVTGGDDIRFFAGNATPASAPFYVTESGALFASSATISGTITADDGSIGGWEIGSTYLRKLSSNVGIVLDSWLTQITVGNLSATYIVIDGANESIYSSNFVAGASGSHWDTSTGNAEFNNLVARGELKTFLLTSQNQMAVSGNIVVSKDAGKIVGDITSGSTTIDFGKSMTVGDWVKFQGQDSTGGTSLEWVLVGSNVTGNIYNVTRNVDGSGANGWLDATPFVVIGQVGDGRIELVAGSEASLQLITQGETWDQYIVQASMSTVEGAVTAGNGAVLLDEDGQRFPDGGDGISYDDIAYKEHAIQGMRTYADASISRLETLLFQVESETSTISNGDFETGDFTSWTETDPDAKLSIATTDRGYSLRFNGSASNTNYITQSLSSSAPNGIVVKLKAKASATSGVYVGTTASLGTAFQIPTSSKWRIFTFIVAEATSDVRIRPYGTGYIDDIEVYELKNFGGTPTAFPFSSFYLSPLSSNLDTISFTHQVNGTTKFTSHRYGSTVNSLLLGVATLAAASTLTPTDVYSISTIRLTATGATDIYGIATEYLFSQNKFMTLMNISSYTLTLKHNSTATTYHRFSLPNSADVSIPPGGGAVLQYYDAGGGSSTPRWYLISSFATAPTDASITFTDITTNNVTSTKHGFAPKSPADATKFLNGAATPDYALVKDSDLSTSDITTNDASTTKHGFVVKATAPAANVLNVVGIANGETVYTNKALFDATNPAALGTAAPGTSLIAAHRDHVHATPITVEQTTFTPRIDGTGTAGTGTYTTQTGYYTRIGNTVLIDIELVWTAHTGTGNMTVEGLPVTSNANVSSILSVFFSNITLGAAGNKVQARVLVSTTSIQLTEVGGGSAAALALDTAATLRLTGFYFV